MSADSDLAVRFGNAVESLLGISASRVGRLGGGEEATVARVDTSAGPIVVQERPSWRTRAEIEWVHAVVRQAAREVPEAVAPIERDGQSVFEWDGRLLAFYPFVEGERLDREDPALRVEAAHLLAAIHLALLDWKGAPRPDPGPGAPTLVPDPPDLSDAALDAWWSAVRETLVVGATHGDYYRGNLLCSGDRIVGVVDWSEASVRSIALELAGATFELCRDDEHTFRAERADDFIGRYRSAGGPVPAEELKVLLPLIRVWVRNDARWALALGERDGDGYAGRQTRAFCELASFDWRPA